MLKKLAVAVFSLGVVAAAPAPAFTPTQEIQRSLVTDDECYYQCLTTCLKLGGGTDCHGHCLDVICPA